MSNMFLEQHFNKIVAITQLRYSICFNSFYYLVLLFLALKAPVIACSKDKRLGFKISKFYGSFEVVF